MIRRLTEISQSDLDLHYRAKRITLIPNLLKRAHHEAKEKFDLNDLKLHLSSISYVSDLCFACFGLVFFMLNYISRI